MFVDLKNEGGGVYESKGRRKKTTKFDVSAGFGGVRKQKMGSAFVKNRDWELRGLKRPESLRATRSGLSGRPVLRTSTDD